MPKKATKKHKTQIGCSKRSLKRRHLGGNKASNSFLPYYGKGGTCAMCSAGTGNTVMLGGGGDTEKHRVGCKCSKCKQQKGGANAFVGSPINYGTSSGLPGADGIAGDRNHYALNTGGRRRKQKGGVLSNFMGQDLINLGRQFQFGVGTAYNALSGYSAPVNPLPWTGQLTHKPVLM